MAAFVAQKMKAGVYTPETAATCSMYRHTCRTPEPSPAQPVEHVFRRVHAKRRRRKNKNTMLIQENYKKITEKGKGAKKIEHRRKTTTKRTGGRRGREWRRVRGGIHCIAAVVWPSSLAFLQCRDGACRVFSDQADMACTKRKAPRGVR